MARFIDSEAETTDLVFHRCDEKAPFLGTGIALAATCCDDLGHAGMMIGAESGDDDPVTGMRRFEGPAVPLVGRARCQHVAGDRLPCVRLPVLQVFSATRRSYVVNNAGKVIVTAAQKQSSS